MPLCPRPQQKYPYTSCLLNAQPRFRLRLQNQPLHHLDKRLTIVRQSHRLLIHALSQLQFLTHARTAQIRPLPRRFSCQLVWCTHAADPCSFPNFTKELCRRLSRSTVSLSQPCRSATSGKALSQPQTIPYSQASPRPTDQSRALVAMVEIRLSTGSSMF